MYKKTHIYRRRDLGLRTALHLRHLIVEPAGAGRFPFESRNFGWEGVQGIQGVCVCVQGVRAGCGLAPAAEAEEVVPRGRQGREQGLGSWASKTKRNANKQSAKAKSAGKGEQKEAAEAANRTRQRERERTE